MLVSQMDPIMVDAVKEIVKADMREELERLQNSDDGCSQKCKMIVQMCKLDVQRNEALVQELINFHWCDQCKKTTAVQVCHAGCGPKVFARLVPHMKEFGRIGKKIKEIRSEVEQLDGRAIKFKDYKKSKAEMEHELIKQGAQEQIFTDDKRHQLESPGVAAEHSMK